MIKEDGTSTVHINTDIDGNILATDEQNSQALLQVNKFAGQSVTIVFHRGDYIEKLSLDNSEAWILRDLLNAALIQSSTME